MSHKVAFERRIGEMTERWEAESDTTWQALDMLADLCRRADGTHEPEMVDTITGEIR